MKTAGVVAIIFWAILAYPARAESRVVAVFEGMARYAEAVAADPRSDRAALWKREVLDPYWGACAEGARYLDYGPSLQTPIADVESLKAAGDTLRASSIENDVRAALQTANDLLPGPATTVCIMAGDTASGYLRDLHGVGGFTPGAGKVWLTILPEGDWKEWVIHAVAHEYHHSVWMAGDREIADLSDYLVFEGRADSFARLVDPERQPPWTDAFGEADERRAWETLRAHLASTDAPTMQALMFGGVNDVPRWTGYTIGFRLVQAYLKAHPDISVREWTDLSSSEFIKWSVVEK